MLAAVLLSNEFESNFAKKVWIYLRLYMLNPISPILYVIQYLLYDPNIIAVHPTKLYSTFSSLGINVSSSILKN